MKICTTHPSIEPTLGHFQDGRAIVVEKADRKSVIYSARCVSETVVWIAFVDACASQRSPLPLIQWMDVTSVSAQNVILDMSVPISRVKILIPYATRTLSFTLSRARGWLAVIVGLTIHVHARGWHRVW